MVNKQAIDNNLYTMDNEVHNPFVQMTNREVAVFFSPSSSLYRRENNRSLNQ
jgi:hypothetical protein